MCLAKYALEGRGGGKESALEHLKNADQILSRAAIVRRSIDLNKPLVANIVTFLEHANRTDWDSKINFDARELSDFLKRRSFPLLVQQLTELRDSGLLEYDRSKKSGKWSINMDVVLEARSLCSGELAENQRVQWRQNRVAI